MQCNSHTYLNAQRFESKTHGGETEILSFGLFTASNFYLIKTENISIISYSTFGVHSFCTGQIKSEQDPHSL